MKLTDEQLKKLLQEQAEIEQQQLTAPDTEAYALLFEALDDEKSAATGTPTADITDNVMAEIILLEERKDRRKDLFNLVSGILVGLLAISAVYFFVDLPLLKTALLWLKAYSPVIAFAMITLFLIQFADRKLIGRN